MSIYGDVYRSAAEILHNKDGCGVPSCGYPCCALSVALERAGPGVDEVESWHTLKDWMAVYYGDAEWFGSTFGRNRQRIEERVLALCFLADICETENAPFAASNASQESK